MKTIVFENAVGQVDTKALLRRISKLTIAVLGDLCLDVYWRADMRKSELSRETPHHPLPVVSEEFSLGGGANVCANIAALGAAKTVAIGTLGDDWRGDILRRCCEEQGIQTDLVVMEPGRYTNTYCKPVRYGISTLAYEDPRIDFCNDTPITKEAEQQILDYLDKLKADALCVSDQLPNGCITNRVRQKVIELGQRGMLVIVDSRAHIGAYRNVVLKPNEVEGYAAVKGCLPPAATEIATFCGCAQALAETNDTDVYMTLGGNGCAYVGKEGALRVTAGRNPAEMDFVGAGDTFLASLGVALAAKASPAQSILFANLCASITIGKLGTTGTASPEEIEALLHAQYRA